MGLLGGIARTAVVAGDVDGGFQSGVTPSGRTLGGAGSVATTARLHAATTVNQRPMFQPPPRAYAQPPVAPPSNDMATRLAQLQQLGALRAQGVVTETEFEEQKRDILGS